jgi:murein DD-endopeptidase MepM/ murein hydrolase activator NlpD
MDEIAATTPSFAGVSYDLLEREGSVQWPCNEKAPTGTPVTAPAPGIVTLADPDLFFSGGTLILDHGHQLSSSFLHLHRLHVAVGDRVEQGQLIGEIGATGRVTGPHLDWRMNLRDRRIDPTLLVPPMGSEAAAVRP